MSSFTSLWDLTQPPDTQPAKLLGQDIRELKVAVSDRLRHLSGPVVDRPTLESVFGDPSDGMLFYATDENILYRFNGATWDAVRDMNQYMSIGASQSAAIATVVPLWLATEDCVIASIKAIRQGGTGATVNVDNNGLLLRAQDLSLVSAGVWTDAGALQNFQVSANTPVSIHFNTFSGSPTYVGVQVNLVR